MRAAGVAIGGLPAELGPGLFVRISTQPSIPLVMLLPLLPLCRQPMYFCEHDKHASQLAFLLSRQRLLHPA